MHVAFLVSLAFVAFVVYDRMVEQMPMRMTTSVAARHMSVSRQHVVDLCERGDLEFTSTGKHRRVSQRSVEEFLARSRYLTRDQERSLWLGAAVAGVLVSDPESVLAKARRNLEKMHDRDTGRHQEVWISRWTALVTTADIPEIVRVLTSRSELACELRQNTPFAGALPEDNRQRVLSAFRQQSADREA